MGDQKGNRDRRYCNYAQSCGWQQKNGWNDEPEHPVKNDEVFSGAHFSNAHGVDQGDASEG